MRDEFGIDWRIMFRTDYFPAENQPLLKYHFRSAVLCNMKGRGPLYDWDEDISPVKLSEGVTGLIAPIYSRHLPTAFCQLKFGSHDTIAVLCPRAECFLLFPNGLILSVSGQR